MIISSLQCDICHKIVPYPNFSHLHTHPESGIDYLYINHWTPICEFNIVKSNNLVINKDQPGISKFKNYLPSHLKIISKGEGNTPLTRLPKLSKNYNYDVFLKNESTNPTGSFKDRGMPLLLGDAILAKKRSVCIPSTGNAASSLSYYSKFYNIKPIIFMPSTTSNEKIKAIANQQAEIIFDKNIIESWNHFFNYCAEHKETYNGFPVTNIPYQQGIKTITYEIYLQMNKSLPDWLIIPCGSGGNIVSQYQACQDLFNLGLIKKIPKFVSVQIKGADPITVGYNKHQKEKIVILDKIKESKAEGIASDTCFNYYKILNIFEQTNGLAVSVTDKEIDSIKNSENLEYSSLSVFAAFEKIKYLIKKNERVVLIGTANINK